MSSRKDLLHLSVSLKDHENRGYGNHVRETSDFARQLAMHKRFEEESRFLDRRHARQRIEPEYRPTPEPYAEYSPKYSHQENNTALQRQVDTMMEEMDHLKAKADNQLQRNIAAQSPILPFNAKTSAEEDLDRIRMKFSSLESTIEKMQQKLSVPPIQNRNEPVHTTVIEEDVVNIAWFETASGKSWLNNKFYMWLESASVKRTLNEMIEIMVLDHVSKTLATGSAGGSEAVSHASNIRKILAGMERKLGERVTTLPKQVTPVPEPRLVPEPWPTENQIHSDTIDRESESQSMFSQAATSTTAISDISISSHVAKSIGKLVRRTSGLDSAYRYVTIMKALWDRYPELHDTKSYEAAGRLVRDSVADDEQVKIHAQKPSNPTDWVSVNEKKKKNPTSDVSAYAFIGANTVRKKKHGRK